MSILILPKWSAQDRLLLFWKLRFLSEYLLLCIDSISLFLCVCVQETHFNYEES